MHTRNTTPFTQAEQEVINRFISDFKYRLSLGTQDEAAIGAYELLDELNRVEPAPIIKCVHCEGTEFEPTQFFYEDRNHDTLLCLACGHRGFSQTEDQFAAIFARTLSEVTPELGDPAMYFSYYNPTALRATSNPDMQLPAFNLVSLDDAFNKALKAIRAKDLEAQKFAHDLYIKNTSAQA
jgi:hypothetical protein